MTQLLKKAKQKLHRNPTAPASIWRESADACALADEERHLGHAIRVGKLWIAYDAIHLNPTKDGFRVIGTFASASAAKEAVEQSVEVGWALELPGLEQVEESHHRILHRRAMTGT